MMYFTECVCMSYICEFVRTLNDRLFVLIDSVLSYIELSVKIQVHSVLNTSVSCFHCISLLLGCMGVSEIMASAFILKSPLQKLLLWCQVMVSDDNIRVF